ncbi:MAG: VanZ family protein [Treponema sp.]|nr:VanZ family protein [Treponema sp.]
MVYVCIIVIVRIVYFPWHHINGHIGTLNFDVSKIFPFKINIIPFKFLTDVYDGWQMNIVGNILMFVPVGIIWPFCFKKLNSVWKAFAAGFFFSFCIELSQLMFYDRCSDIDDLFLNSAGVFIGSALYFGMMQVFCRLKSDKI